MTKSLKTADGKYWVGNNINPSDFLLIQARMYGLGNDNVTFVVEKSELDKIPNSSTWSIKEKAEAFVEVKDDLSDEYQYTFVAVVSDPTEVKNYVKGYNHSVYSIKVIPNANEQYDGAVGNYEFMINSKNSNMFANGGQPRGLKGKNFSEKIENNQKFKKLINITFNSQSSAHKYPEEFIKAIALIDKAIVKNEGSLYVKGYTYSGTLTHFEFMDLPSFKEALEFVDRPKPQNFKFEDGGAVGVGGTMDTSMDDAPMIGGTMDSSMYAKGGLIVTSIKDIPNFQQRLNEGKITYRGLGMGKLMDDFLDIAGESGTRIKVDGKEYFITDTEFNTFSRGADGRMRIKFDAPHRRSYAKGGNVGRYSKIDLVVKKPWGNEEHEVAKFKTTGDAIISANALGKNAPSNYDYSVTSTNKYAKGGRITYSIMDAKDGSIVKGGFATEEEAKKYKYANPTKFSWTYVIVSSDWLDKHKFAEGGAVEKEYIVVFENQETGDKQKVNVLATSENSAKNSAYEESGLSDLYEIVSVRVAFAQGGAVHYTSEGKLRMKKMYDSIADYLTFAKVGDAIWIGNDPSEFEYAGKSHLWKVQEVRPNEIIVKAFGRTGLYNLSAKSFSQKVVVVGDNTYARGGNVEDDLYVAEYREGEWTVKDRKNPKGNYTLSSKRQNAENVRQELIDNPSTLKYYRTNEYAKGGIVGYANQDYENKLGVFNSLLDAKKFAKANKWKYETITFEDENGDDIVVTNSDTFKDIDWLFSNQYAKGGTVKTNKRTLDKIANVYFDLFDVVGAESGGELREDKAMLAKFSKLLEEKLSKIIAKKSLSTKDFDYYEDNNYHLLNEFLSWNDYFATDEFKDMYKRLAQQYKRSNSTLADPKYIVVKTATVAPTQPVMADPTPLATPTEATVGKPNYKVNAQIKSVKFTTKSGKTKTVSGDMVLNGAHYFKKGGSVKADYEYFPKATVVEVTLTDGSKIKPLNGYWVSKTVKFGMGGGVKPFEYTANGATVYINGTKGDVKAMYLDYVNNFLTIEGFADYYGISDAQAKSILKAGREYAEKDGQFAEGGQFGESYEVVVVSKEADKDGGRKHKDRFLVFAVDREDAIRIGTQMWNGHFGKSDLAIVEVLTADEYREKYLKPKYAEGGSVSGVMSFEEFKKTLPVLHDMIVLDNSVEYKPMYDRYSGTTKYFRHGRRNLKSYTLREAYEHYEYFASKGKKFAEGGTIQVGDEVEFSVPYFNSELHYKGKVIEFRGHYVVVEYENLKDMLITTQLDLSRLKKVNKYADGGRTRKYDGLNEQDKFIADQIYHVIGLRLISEKKNVIKNSILANLDIYNLEKNPKRIVKDNLEYALTLKSPSAVNNTMEATINALRSSVYAKGGVADDFKNFFGGIGRTIKSGYEKTRDFTNNQVHAQKKRIALEVIDDTKDKVRSNRDKMDLKGAEEIVENHYADGGMVKNPTKAQYESYLNGLGTPSSDHPDNGGRVSRKMIEKYGTWLRKNDPIAFEVGYNEFRAQ